VQCRSRGAESPRMTTSSTPRSRAAARIVSAAVLTRSPLTTFIRNGWVWRHTSSPGRRGRESALSIAAKTGCATAAGSHQPLSRAAVRCEKAAVLGQNQLPRRQFLELGTAQRRGVHPSSDAFPFPAPQPSPAGEPGLCRTVTREACGRRSQSSEPPAHLGTGLGAGSLLWKPFIFHRHPCETGHSPPASLETGHSQLHMSQIRVGSDRFRHVEEWRAKW
jgi:hypothetical protein